MNKIIINIMIYKIIIIAMKNNKITMLKKQEIILKIMKIKIQNIKSKNLMIVIKTILSKI